VRVYYNPTKLQAVVEHAEKMAFRRVGLPITTQRAHGFAGEVEVNAPGIAPYLKFCEEWFWKHREEYERLQRKEELQKQLEQLDKTKGASPEVVK
jgi:hypothetical protein